MAVRKKFDRPLPRDEEADARASRPVRLIQLPREGGALDGVYASVSAHESVRLAPHQVRRGDVASDAFKTWICHMVLWGMVVILLSFLLAAN